MITRTAAVGGLLAVVLVGCAGDDADEPEPGPPAQALTAANCSPISYGGPGRPRFLIVNSSGYQGVFKGHGVQTAQAMKLVLAKHGWRAGPTLSACRSARRRARPRGRRAPKVRAQCARVRQNRSALAVVGPLTSNCAVHMLPILNKAPKGPLATISGGNTYVGLTRAGPGTAVGEPGSYAPTGRRGGARTMPADDIQGRPSPSGAPAEANTGVRGRRPVAVRPRAGGRLRRRG